MYNKISRSRFSVLFAFLPMSRKHMKRSTESIKNIGSTMKHGQQTEQKSRQRLSSWQPMRWILSLPRLSLKVVPVTRTGVKVRVTRSRMILPLRWQLMQNSMSSCKLLMVQWARTFMTKRISLGQSTANFRDWSWFLRDGPWRGCLFLYKNVWTTLTEYWRGCCWEVQTTRVNPPEPLLSLHKVAKCLTMQLAVYLAKEVAAILRAVLTHETKKLYNDGTVHLLCSNYWIQPIYQELLHSSSRYNATREGERKRPSSGLARVAAHPRPPKSGSHQLLAPAFVIGLVVSATRIPCRYGFFLAVPCALEAQTVINTSCFDWRFPHKREKVKI